MWTLEQALTLVRELQPELHARKYHAALGGGVLNTGLSYHDLDLYIFPFDVSDIDPIMPWLVTVLGPFEPFSKVDAGRYPADVNFEVKVKFDNVQNTGKRIDVFITKNGVVANGKSN